jgi:hypothetical protein
MRRKRPVGGPDEQLPAHAEVSEERVVTGRQPQVLAPAPRAGQGTPGQDGAEILGTGQVAADSARVQDADRFDLAADHVALEAGPHDLDFR